MAADARLSCSGATARTNTRSLDQVRYRVQAANPTTTSARRAPSRHGPMGRPPSASTASQAPPPDKSADSRNSAGMSGTSQAGTPRARRRMKPWATARSSAATRARARHHQSRSARSRTTSSTKAPPSSELARHPRRPHPHQDSQPREADAPPRSRPRRSPPAPAPGPPRTRRSPPATRSSPAASSAMAYQPAPRPPRTKFTTAGQPQSVWRCGGISSTRDERRACAHGQSAR